jgi:ribosome-associated protein
VIPAAELEWRFSRSGGPGGQHANTSDTRVELRWDIAGSPTLREADRERLMERLGPLVQAVAADERSQARNRVLAQERLQSRVAAALRRDPARRPTRPSRSAVERRLSDKRRQAERKAERRRPEEG